jgi:hypothetical protein
MRDLDMQYPRVRHIHVKTVIAASGFTYVFVNSTTRLHLVGSFYEFHITMHGFINIKSVTNCQSTLRNIPEERRSHLHRDRSLQSRHWIGQTADWLWPVSAPLNLDAIPPRPFLRVSRMHGASWTFMSVIATDTSNPLSFESQHVFIHILAFSSYNYCLSDFQLFRKCLYYKHNLTTRIKLRIKVILLCVLSTDHSCHTCINIVLTLLNNNNKKTELKQT